MMDGGVIHPHAGVDHEVPQGAPPHGAGPDSGHPPMGPRHRYRNRNRPKPKNNVESLPLDEAAKREMESLPLKTPVSVLHELLVQRGKMPKYELVQIEDINPYHTFCYRVTVVDPDEFDRPFDRTPDPKLSALGTACIKKKEAKHSAAKALLDKLTGATPAADQEINRRTKSGALVMQYQYRRSIYLGNPVMWLQELCMSRFWPLPSYRAENDEAEVNRCCGKYQRRFTRICTLLNRRIVATGKTKKVAKHVAAHKMLYALHGNPPDFIQPYEAVTPLNNKDFNFIQFLQEIASEQSFEVTYMDIDEKSMRGDCQCLVQLSTLPVAVCYGWGPTNKDAQFSAAQNALEYLKIMTKK